MRLVTLMLGASIIASSASEAGGKGARVSIPIAPPPVVTDGSHMIAFEVLIELSSLETGEFEALSVLDDRSSTPLVTFKAAELASRLAVTETADPLGRRLRIYVEIVVPGRLASRVLVATVTLRDGDGVEHLASSIPVVIEEAAIAELGPPLRGGPWVAVHAPKWPRGHRRVIYTAGGRRSPAQTLPSALNTQTAVAATPAFLSTAEKDWPPQCLA